MKIGDSLFKPQPPEAPIMAEVGDWIVARTNSGTIEGTLEKINHKRFVVRLQSAGKFKRVTRRHADLLARVDFY